MWKICAWYVYVDPFLFKICYGLCCSGWLGDSYSKSYIAPLIKCGSYSMYSLWETTLKGKVKLAQPSKWFHYQREVSLILYKKLLFFCRHPTSLLQEHFWWYLYFLIALHWFVCKPFESQSIKVIAMLWLSSHGNNLVINFYIKNLKNNPGDFPPNKL